MGFDFGAALSALGRGLPKVAQSLTDRDEQERQAKLDAIERQKSMAALAASQASTVNTLQSTANDAYKQKELEAKAAQEKPLEQAGAAAFGKYTHDLEAGKKYNTETESMHAIKGIGQEDVAPEPERMLDPSDPQGVKLLSVPSVPLEAHYGKDPYAGVNEEKRLAGMTPQEHFAEAGGPEYAGYDKGLGNVQTQLNLEEATKTKAEKDRQALEEKERNRAFQEKLLADRIAGEAPKLAETERHNKAQENKPRAVARPPAIPGEKPGTAAQELSAGYALRAVESNAITEKLQGAGFDAGKIENAVMNPDNLNLIKDPTQRQYTQAARNFINAVLRPESGAAIAESEFKNAYRQYFAQPGDDSATEAQKRENRLQKIASLKASAGPAYDKTLTEYSKLKAPAGGQSGTTKSGKKFTIIQ